MKQFSKILRSKVKRSSKSVIVPFLVAAFLFGLIASFIFRNASFSLPSILPKTSTPDSKASAILTLSSDAKRVKVGQSFSVKINLNSLKEGVEAADFVVTYDPTYLAVVNLTEGNFFKNYPIKKIEANFIKLSGVATLVQNTVTVPRGKGEVGTITFTAVKSIGKTMIGFDRAKTIVASGGQNIVDSKKLTDVSIRIRE